MITGVRGFLGRRLAAALEATGALVAGTTRGRPVRRPAPGRTVVHHLDLCSAFAVRRAVAAIRPDVVYHLAGQSRPGRAFDDPLDAFEANVRTTWTLLDAVRTTGAPTMFVLASTGAAASEGPYVTSKACAELVCRSYAASYRLPVAIIRCGHVYGPDGDEERLVTSIVAAAVAGRAVRVRDPVRRFDLLFVDDAVAGLAAVAGTDGGAGIHEYALSSGCTIAAGDVAHLVERLVDGAAMGDADPSTEPSRKTGPASGGQAPAGWWPRTSLAGGLTRTIAWHRCSGGEK
jgi:nucleoside-diphosphate-sugar epimerase